MSLTLYPYVYLLARAAFAEQAPSTYDAARTLGAGRGPRVLPGRCCRWPGPRWPPAWRW